MKVKFERTYKNEKGTQVFVYSVDGTEKELTEYEEAQGSFFRKDQETDVPLWFTTRSIGPRGKLIITGKGKVIADMSEYEQAASMAKQFGGNFGAELARASVAALLGKSDSEPVTEA